MLGFDDDTADLQSASDDLRIIRTIDDEAISGILSVIDTHEVRALGAGLRKVLALTDDSSARRFNSNARRFSQKASLTPAISADTPADSAKAEPAARKPDDDAQWVAAEDDMRPNILRSSPIVWMPKALKATQAMKAAKKAAEPAVPAMKMKAAMKAMK